MIIREAGDDLRMERLQQFEMAVEAFSRRDGRSVLALQRPEYLRIGNCRAAHHDCRHTRFGHRPCRFRINHAAVSGYGDFCLADEFGEQIKMHVSTMGL